MLSQRANAAACQACLEPVWELGDDDVPAGMLQPVIFKCFCDRKPFAWVRVHQPLDAQLTVFADSLLAVLLEVQLQGPICKQKLNNWNVLCHTLVVTFVVE